MKYLNACQDRKQECVYQVLCVYLHKHHNGPIRLVLSSLRSCSGQHLCPQKKEKATAKSHIPSLSVAVRDSSSLLPLSRSLLGVPDSVSLLPVRFESVRTGLMGPVGMNDGTLIVGWLWVVFISARNGRKQLDLSNKFTHFCFPLHNVSLQYSLMNTTQLQQGSLHWFSCREPS